MVENKNKQEMEGENKETGACCTSCKDHGPCDDSGKDKVMICPNPLYKEPPKKEEIELTKD